MAKGMYGSINGSTRKIKKNYAVVGGVTRKITRMYAVVDGKTRLIFTSEPKPSRYGTASSGLSSTRNYLLAASVGDYAVFAGGALSYPMKTVDAYNSSLTRSIPNELWDARSKGSGAKIGNYALFAGGHGFDGYSSYYSLSSVETYDSSLTHSSTWDLQSKREYLSSVVLGDYAIFAGGEDYSESNSYTNDYDAYDSSLSHQTGYLYYGLRSMGATAAGDSAIFAGGYSYSGSSNTVVFMNKSFTKSTGTNLKQGISNSRGGSTKDYGIIAGGDTGSTFVAAWNSSLTLSYPTALSAAKTGHAAVSLNGYVIIGGGFSHGAVVNVYDNSLTRTNLDEMTALEYCDAATTGNYALFAGHSNSSKVEVYQVV